MHKVSIAAIVKNEGAYLDEWLSFHIIQGVTQFYIFDNGSTDNTREVLAPYLKKHFITYLPFPGVAKQLSAYATALKFFAKDTEWMAFLDCDEFLFSETGLLEHALSTYEQAEQVLVQWEMFGSNGHKKKEDGLVIERFIKRGREPNQHVKAVVRPKYVSIGINPHVFSAEKRHTVNVLGKAIDPVAVHLRPVTSKNLRLAHYFTKSREEFETKVARGRADTGTIRDLETYFRKHDINEVEDRSLVAFRHDVLKKIREIRDAS